MAINGKKINELEGIIQSDLTNNTVVPVVVVDGATPRSTATKVTLEQLKNWIVGYVGNPRIVEIPVQAGTTLSVTDANLIVMLFRNGNLLRILDDYTTTTNSITFTMPLEADEKITALYSIVAPYVIPVATTTTTGTVKYDGTTIKLNSDGQLYAEVGSSYTAGTGIDISNNTISATNANDVVQITETSYDFDDTDIAHTLVPGKIYKFTQALTDLTISNYTNAFDEITIIFTSGATPTILTVPDTFSWINNAPSIVANKGYILSIVNGLIVYGEYTVNN